MITESSNTTIIGGEKMKIREHCREGIRIAD